MLELRGDTLYYQGQPAAQLLPMKVGLRRDFEDELGVSFPNDGGEMVDYDKIETYKEAIEDQCKQFVDAINAVTAWFNAMTFFCPLERVAYGMQLDTLLDALAEIEEEIEAQAKNINAELYL